MYYELSNPTYRFIVACPAASERVTGKVAVDGNPNVRACGIIGQVFRSQSSLTESYITTLYFSAGKQTGESLLTSLCKRAYHLCSVLAPNAVMLTEEL